MTACYQLEYTTTPDLFLRAMVSWEQPKLSSSKKFLRTGVLVAAALGFAAFVAFLMAVDFLSPGIALAASLGFLLGAGIWQDRNRRDSLRLIGMAMDLMKKQGSNRATLSAQGFHMETDVGTSHTQWGAFSHVFVMQDATALVSGASVHPIPNSALPEGVEVATFQTDIKRWVEDTK